IVAPAHIAEELGGHFVPNRAMTCTSNKSATTKPKEHPAKRVRQGIVGCLGRGKLGKGRARPLRQWSSPNYWGKVCKQSPRMCNRYLAPIYIVVLCYTCQGIIYP